MGNGNRNSAGILKELRPHLLFCPFTLPHFYHSKIPIVSIIYDLQFHYYPQFFETHDLRTRAGNFHETCRLATRLVCISEYVRQTVLQNSKMKPEKVVSVPIRLSNRLPRPSPQGISAILDQLALREGGFFLYPANFWPHKNHAMLLTAMGMFFFRHPGFPIRFVCTGSADREMESLREAAQRMGLESKVIFPGFLNSEEFSALFASCRALIFPSLYEGFGMPVLEAMNLGKPVLCSNVTSLPEVAGEAASFFDPRKPGEILAAIEKLVGDRDFERNLIARGKKQAEPYHDSERMAREYLKVFTEVLR